MHDNKDEIEYQMRIRVFASLAETGNFFNTLGGIISHPVALLMLNDFSDSGLNFSFTY